jgi:hypothetical protein
VTLIALTLLVIVFIDAQFIGGFRPLDSGDDGLTYEGYARRIVRHLVAGEFPAGVTGAPRISDEGGSFQKNTLHSCYSIFCFSLVAVQAKAMTYVTRRCFARFDQPKHGINRFTLIGNYPGQFIRRS